DDPWVFEPRVSDGLKTILRRLLAHDLEERYASADALLADLQAVAGGSLPGGLPPAGPPLLVAPRPSTAKPLVPVTAELRRGESQRLPRMPPVVAPGTKTQAAFRVPRLAESDSGVELAPPTIDPDAPPRKKAGEKPGEKDPDAPYFNVGQAPAGAAAPEADS